MASIPSHNAQRIMTMQKTFLAVAFTLATFFIGPVDAAPAAYKEPLNAQSLSTIKSQFSQLMALAARSQGLA